MGDGWPGKCLESVWNPTDRQVKALLGNCRSAPELEVRRAAPTQLWFVGENPAMVWVTRPGENSRKKKNRLRLFQAETFPCVTVTWSLSLIGPEESVWDRDTGHVRKQPGFNQPSSPQDCVTLL